MAGEENPPFDLGQSFYNGDTINTANLDAGNLEGKEYEFPSSRITGNPSDEKVRVRVCRNTGTTNLKPCLIAKMDLAPPAPILFGSGANGYTCLDDDYGFPVDPLGPPAGFVPNDLFYVIVKGPTLVITPTSGGIAVSVGSFLVSLTAASSGATNAGCVNVQAIQASTADNVLNAAMIQNRLARAMSAVTTGQTATQFLARIGMW